MRHFSLLSAWLLCAFAARVEAQDVANAWASRFAGFKGTTACAYGDPHCNRCVYNVEQQFRAITQGNGGAYEIKKWSWNNDTDYSPNCGTDPNCPDKVQDVYTLLPSDGSHFQSIGRAPASSPNMMFTYAGDPAGIFMADGEETSNGRVQSVSMDTLHWAQTKHPGGIQGIGQYFTVASYSSSNAYVEVFNGSTPHTPSQKVLITNGADKEVASLAGAQLAGGGYLFATNVTSKNKNYRFWYTPSLDTPNFEPIWTEQVSTDNQPSFSDAPDGASGFEGVSFVTECGTGTVYMIGINGWQGYAGNNGIWSLFKVEQAGKPKLTYVTRNTNDMHFPACNTRSGGSAFAGKHGNLGLYCTQKARDEATRIYGIQCGLTVAWTVLAPAFPLLSTIGTFFGASSCIKIGIKEQEAGYTEWWSNLATPETPSASTTGYTKLDVTVSGAPGYTDGSVTIAVDETPNDTTTGTAVYSCGAQGPKCSFNIKNGAKVRLISTASDNGQAEWNDSYCASHAVRLDQRNTVCDFPVWGAPAKAVVAEAWVLI